MRWCTNLPSFDSLLFHNVLHIICCISWHTTFLIIREKFGVSHFLRTFLQYLNVTVTLKFVCSCLWDKWLIWKQWSPENNPIPLTVECLSSLWLSTTGKIPSFWGFESLTSNLISLTSFVSLSRVIAYLTTYLVIPKILTFWGSAVCLEFCWG